MPSGRETADVQQDRIRTIRNAWRPPASGPTSRVLGYSGQGRLAMPHRGKAVAGRYPQALFVNGFLHLTGQNDNPKDPCKAGELMRESAIEGRLAGLLGFLDAARQQVAGDFYRTMLVDLLRDDRQASTIIR